MNFLLKFGIIGNLIFTIFGLVIMTLPSLIWYFLYSERWYLIVSTIHTMVLIVMGYKHLNKIKSQKEA
jgi:membrane protein implicated in regulation of membrane protease activity